MSPVSISWRMKNVGEARFAVAVHDGPVDGRRPAVLRQQRGVQVESAQRGHVPHGFGQHPEGHHDLQRRP
jgi:hypothetical protein